MKVLSGKEFNKIYKDKSFWKFANKEENHNRFQFKDGLNIDTIPFINPTQSCQAGGIYFIESEYRIYWLHWLENMHFIRKVKIPNDGTV